MTVYTVHEPPLRGDDAAVDTDRFTFVRDGFYFWAFLLGPLWLIWRRLWLVLLGYVALTALVQAGLWALGASAVQRFVIGFLIALLLGMEAGTLRRWTLNRRGSRNLGVVVAPDLETAERRFFDSWVVRDTSAPRHAPPSLPPAPTLQMPPADDVVGLFPEPQGRS